MNNKKIIFLTITTVLATTISICALADGSTTTNDGAAPIINGSGFTLGVDYATWGVNNFALTGGYLNHWISANIGTSFRYNGATAINHSSHLYELRAEFGLRQALEHTFFLTYGLFGSRGFRNLTGVTDPYALGGYVGFDYQPLEHIVLSTQIAPYAYQHDENRINHSSVFSEGSFGVSYIFN